MMKWQMIFLVTAITALGQARMCSAEIPQTADASKISALAWLPEVLRHACWPSERDLLAKRVNGGDLGVEVSTLKEVLSATLRQKYQPESSFFELGSVIAATNLYDSGDDYLLLRYSAGKDLQVEVQDGKTLCMLVQSASWSSNGLENVGPFVRGIAFALLRYPSDVKETNLNVFVSTMDIGNSKWGQVLWGQDGRSRFSLICWWSDGKRVLFCVQKATEKEFEARRNERRPSAIPDPDRQRRKFGKPWWSWGHICIFIQIALTGGVGYGEVVLWREH